MFSSYVAISRVADNRHWLSDAVFGSTVGIIAGRTVTGHELNQFPVTRQLCARRRHGDVRAKALTTVAPSDRERLKGHLDLLLLAAVKDCRAHGRAIVETMRVRSHDALKLPEGTIYPALLRLERAGLLMRTSSEGSGRRLRMYQLTAKGSLALIDQQRAWREFVQAVDSVIGDSA